MVSFNRHDTGERGSEKIPDEWLIADLIRVWLKLGRSPKKEEYNDEGLFSAATIKDRFGGWNEIKNELGMQIRQGGGGGPSASLEDVNPSDIGLSELGERRMRTDGGGQS